MDKLKWAVFIFAVLSIVGGAVVYMTGQQGLNWDFLSSPFLDR